jgi:hypothetical protein
MQCVKTSVNPYISETLPSLHRQIHQLPCSTNSSMLNVRDGWGESSVVELEPDVGIQMPLLQDTEAALCSNRLHL